MSHDAGGAEVVSSWVKQHPMNKYVFMLGGPALDIYSRKLGSIDILRENELAELEAGRLDLVLTSTSWASDCEKIALRWANKNGINSASFLDHWCNYRARFEYDSEMILPDEIWVGDDDAYELAMQCFDDLPVKLVLNPYFKDIEKEFSQYQRRIKSEGVFRILYLCEAIVEGGRRLSSGEVIEYKSLGLFFHHLEDILPESRVAQVRLRTHPAEDQAKYSAYLKSDGRVDVCLSEGTTLVEDCVWSDWVVGMNTMAMVVARIGGKRVGYCNLDAKKPNNIPTTGMVNFLHLTSLE